MKEFPHYFFEFLYDNELLFKRKVLSIFVKRKSEISVKDLLSNPSLKYTENVDEIGLRRIFEFLSAEKKKVIVHNGLLDILYVYNSFFGNVPQDMAEFKKKWNELFSCMFDTKFLVANSNLVSDLVGNNTSLSACYEKMLNVKDIDLDFQMGENFTRYQISGPKDGIFSHEAGFDAFMTGYIFFKSLAYQGFSLIFKFLKHFKGLDFTTMNKRSNYFKNKVIFL